KRDWSSDVCSSDLSKREQIWLTRSLFKPLTDQRHMIRVGLNADRPESLVACRLQRGTAARERVEHGPAWRGDQGDQPFHEREGLYGWMLNLRAVLPFNDGPFTLRRFGLVLEHREEPRRATRDRKSTRLNSSHV